METRGPGWIVGSLVLTVVLTGCSEEPKEIPASVTSISTHDFETRVNVRYRVDNDQDFAGDAECELTSPEGDPGTSVVLTDMQPGERREDEVNFEMTPEEAESVGYIMHCTITEA